MFAIPVIATGLLLIVALMCMCLKYGTRKRKLRQPDRGWNYDDLLDALGGHSTPAVLVDLKRFDENTDRFISKLKRTGKSLRVATKSVRVPELVSRVVHRHPETCIGVMCFSVHEIRLYADDARTADILMAYPIVQPSELELCWEECMQSRQHRLALTLMVDSIEHVEAIGTSWIKKSLSSHEPAPMARLCVDLDVAFQPVRGIYIGAHRSPCRRECDVDDVLSMVATINSWSSGESTHATVPTSLLLHQIWSVLRGRPWSEKKHLLSGPLMSVVGLMGYEAHVAGVPDSSIWDPLRNLAVTALKYFAVPCVQRRRAAIVEYIRSCGVAVDLVNGGGSGSIDSTARDMSVTEVTVGSGLLHSRLFDFYACNEQRPALVFALCVTRKSTTCGEDFITCQSGGFIASGEVSRDKTPSVFLPEGYEELPTEGFGEVQTPLRKVSPSARELAIGDLVFLRPAKAGEIAERFDHYLVMDGHHMAGVTEMKTYRGLGITAY